MQRVKAFMVKQVGDSQSAKLAYDRMPFFCIFESREDAEEARQQLGVYRYEVVGIILHIEEGENVNNYCG